MAKVSGACDCLIAMHLCNTEHVLSRLPTLSGSGRPVGE